MCIRDSLKPTPTVAPLSSASWGVAGVLPRDLSNGIESANGGGGHPEYYYWDGQFIKPKDGKFEIVERNGTIAISDTLCGTYVKQKPTCSYTQNGTDSIYPKRTSIPG